MLNRGAFAFVKQQPSFSTVSLSFSSFTCFPFSNDDLRCPFRIMLNKTLGLLDQSCDSSSHYSQKLGLKSELRYS